MRLGTSQKSIILHDHTDENTHTLSYTGEYNRNYSPIFTCGCKKSNRVEGFYNVSPSATTRESVRGGRVRYGFINKTKSATDFPVEVAVRIWRHKVEVRHMPRVRISRPFSGGWDGIVRKLSNRSRKRMIERAAYIDTVLGYKPNWMLTLTWTGDWKNKDEYVGKWRKAKQLFLKWLGKTLTRNLSEWGYYWFSEFQRRGAPHIHILLYMPGIVWKEWLERFKSEWTKALATVGIDVSKHKGQSVDFKPIRKPGWNYVVKYASKLYQKRPPFPARWGKWYGVGGVFADRVINEIVENFDELYLGEKTEENLKQWCEDIAEEISGYITDRPVKKIAESIFKGIKRKYNLVFYRFRPLELEKQQSLFGNRRIGYFSAD